MSKTFSDLNFHFEIDESCITCRDGLCLSNATLSKTGDEYNICIATNKDYTDIQITASNNSNSENCDDIELYFTSEKDAVGFLCMTFNDFKCV